MNKFINDSLTYFNLPTILNWNQINVHDDKDKKVHRQKTFVSFFLFHYFTKYKISEILGISTHAAVMYSNIWVREKQFLGWMVDAITEHYKPQIFKQFDDHFKLIDYQPLPQPIKRKYKPKEKLPVIAPTVKLNPIHANNIKNIVSDDKINIEKAKNKAFVKSCMEEFALEKQLNNDIPSSEKLRIKRLIQQCNSLKNSGICKPATKSKLT